MKFRQRYTEHKGLQKRSHDQIRSEGKGGIPFPCLVSILKSDHGFFFETFVFSITLSEFHSCSQLFPAEGFCGYILQIHLCNSHMKNFLFLITRLYEVSSSLRKNKGNKAVYTATPVGGSWAEAVMNWAGAIMIWTGELTSMKYSCLNSSTFKQLKNEKRT